MSAAIPIAIVVGALLCGACYLNSGVVRNAGCPHGLADLEGSWVLDHTRGNPEPAPPDTISFSAGSAPNLVRVSDGGRTAEFGVETPGRLVFAAGQQFEPLLPTGESQVYTMTHFCPPLPAWDHLIFFLDGAPVGASKRVVVYERE